MNYQVIYRTIDIMPAGKKTSWGGARPGAGRPRLYSKTHRRSVDFDDSDDRQLREIAAERGVTVIQVIREAVTAYLKRQKTRKKR